MQHLTSYINDSENPRTNFNLGLEYELMGQTGAAISFYLRTAERSESDIEQYEALLRMALCFERQQTRDDTEKTLLEKAIMLIDDRPEAWFLLSRLHEFQQNWQDSYTMASLGLKLAKHNHEPLRTNVQYPGEYGLLFQKGVAAWWVGHREESRRIMHDLKFGKYNMAENFMSAVERNLQVCGWPNNTTAYTPEMRSRCRYKFHSIDCIDKNYSQSVQDMFVLAATDGKSNGTYIEIGSAEPFKNNNTALLETKFNWRGASVDFDSTKVEQFKAERKNPVFCLDATSIDYKNFIDNLNFGTTDIDYLQVDCDPPSVSFDILKKMPFDSYRFATITFEHDYYWEPSVRDSARQFLTSKGYELIAGDIAYNDKHSYEDWWVHPQLIDSTIRDRLRSVNVGIQNAVNYLFPPGT